MGEIEGFVDRTKIRGFDRWVGDNWKEEQMWHAGFAVSYTTRIDAQRVGV
jgi:hypothetical protein